ncbi:hypothetical protein cypCar_00038189 [Cyprinus carpio]|nr:hypothetical protein cypCar_00038189 [Cyprinus carpio]
MVMARPLPCMDLFRFEELYGGTLEEGMSQNSTCNSDVLNIRQYHFPAGTKVYSPLEFTMKGMYYARPMTVWRLEEHPTAYDRDVINVNL